MREAFEAVIERYEALHPNTVVEQMPIPERVYEIWMETKLFGEIAPAVDRAKRWTRPGSDSQRVG